MFIKVEVLEISALINRKLNSLNKDRRSISKVYKPALIIYAFSLLTILKSYINKLIS